MTWEHKIEQHLDERGAYVLGYYNIAVGQSHLQYPSLPLLLHREYTVGKYRFEIEEVGRSTDDALPINLLIRLRGVK